jgi:Tfp pilus assembly protein PilN
MIKINLIPRKVRRQKEAGFELRVLIGTLLFSFLLIGGVYVWNARDMGRLRSDVATAKQQTEALQGVYKEFQFIERDKKEISSRIAVIDKIKEGRAVVPRILYDLSSLTKENVWLKRVVKDETKFSLEGRSIDNESICEFVEHLSKLPYMTGVELKSVEDVNEADTTVKKFVVEAGVAL